MRLLLAWLLGAGFGAFSVWLFYGQRARLYELWYGTLKWIVEDYYGGRVESDKRTGDCGVDFFPQSCVAYKVGSQGHRKEDGK